MLRELKAKEVTFDVKTELEADILVENQAWAKHPKLGPPQIAWIRSQLKIHNDFAWCRVSVTATWDDFSEHLVETPLSFKNAQERDKYVNEVMIPKALRQLDRSVGRKWLALRRLQQEKREQLRETVYARFEAEELDEHVHELKGAEAAVINNAGIEEQFDYLADEAGLDWIEDVLLGGKGSGH